MALPNIFNEEIRKSLTVRINLLQEDSTPQWGKMEVAQMLAHLNIMFEIGLDDRHSRPNPFVRFILQSFVKKKLINEAPYKKNSPTAPEMVIDYDCDFQRQKKDVLDHLALVGVNGTRYFDERQHPSFGKLSAPEWSNLFYKHIDHHLQQFGV